MPNTPNIIKNKVLIVLASGGSLRDAADYARIRRRDLKASRQRDHDFAKDVRHTIATAKLRRLARTGAAPRTERPARRAAFSPHAR